MSRNSASSSGGASNLARVSLLRRDQPAGLLNAILSGSHRYGLATMAPVSVSVAHFLLQMVLLRVVDKAVFGLLALVLGFIQFGFGLSNALVSTPYTLDVNHQPADNPSKLVYFKVNALFSIFWGACCAALAVGFGHAVEAWMFGAFGLLAMVRWFGRAHLYALHRPTRAAISDFIYAAVLLTGIGVAWFTTLSLSTALLLLALASFLGAIAVGRDFLNVQVGRAWGASLRPYATIWRDQARWTLVGVVCSEATSNAHSYVITLVAGPAAFAPIAAATLLVRPISLALTSLTQLERPVMVRQLAAADTYGAARSARVFQIAVVTIWAVTIAAGAALLLWFPRLLFKPSYGTDALTTAFALWSVISAMQCWSTPSSVLLQAAQWFRRLARAGIVSAVVATAAVLAAALLLPPVYSLFGILLGQLVMNLRLADLVRRWTRGEAPASSSPAATLSDTGVAA